MKSVFVVDDHPLVSLSLGLAMRDPATLRLIGSAVSPDEALPQVQSAQPDALVLDLVFDGVLQISSVQRFRSVARQASIVVFSSLPPRLWAKDAVAAGADAYLPKSAPLSDLISLLNQLVCRQPLSKSEGARLSPIGAAAMDIGVNQGADGRGDDSRQAPFLPEIYLTPREIEVARRLARGMSIALIARDLNVSANTASVHRENIRLKLDCRDTKALVARLARMDSGANGTS